MGKSLPFALLKVLMCDMNVYGAKWHDSIFILSHASQMMAVLLHKTALGSKRLSWTVYYTLCCNIFIWKFRKIHTSNKVWINKNETLSKMENSVTSTILIQSSWFSSNLKYPWDDYFDKVSYGLTKNYGCYTIFNFWECLIFYDSDFTNRKRQIESKMNFPDIVILYERMIWI